MGVKLLFRDGVLRQQRLVTLQIQLGVSQQRLVVRHVPLGLLQHDLVGARIHLGDQLALLDKVAFLHRDTHQLSVNPVTHQYGIKRRDRA